MGERREERDPRSVRDAELWQQDQTRKRSNHLPQPLAAAHIELGQQRGPLYQVCGSRDC